MLDALGTVVSGTHPGFAVHLNGGEGMGHTETKSASGCLASQLQSCRDLWLEFLLFQKGT